MISSLKIVALTILILLGDSCQTQKSKSASDTSQASQTATGSATASAGYLKLADDTQAASQQLLASGVCTNATDATTQQACEAANNYVAANPNDTALVLQDPTVTEQAQESVEQQSGSSGLNPAQISGITLMVVGAGVTASASAAFAANYAYRQVQLKKMVNADLITLFGDEDAIPAAFKKLKPISMIRLNETYDRIQTINSFAKNYKVELNPFHESSNAKTDFLLGDSTFGTKSLNLKTPNQLFGLKSSIKLPGREQPLTRAEYSAFWRAVAAQPTGPKTFDVKDLDAEEKKIQTEENFMSGGHNEIQETKDFGGEIGKELVPKGEQSSFSILGSYKTYVSKRQDLMQKKLAFDFNRKYGGGFLDGSGKYKKHQEVFGSEVNLNSKVGNLTSEDYLNFMNELSDAGWSDKSEINFHEVSVNPPNLHVQGEYNSKPIGAGISAAVGVVGAAIVGVGGGTLVGGSLGLTSEANAPVTTYINALANISAQLMKLDNGE